MLGYPDIADAADAVPAILPHEPIALEGVDDRSWSATSRSSTCNPDALGEPRRADASCMVQFGGDTAEEARRARGLTPCSAPRRPGRREVPRRPRTGGRALGTSREAGLGATAHLPDRPDTFEGWEDSAVPPERLGEYLRRLRALYGEFGYDERHRPRLYGHFGQGCVHTRIPFDLLHRRRRGDLPPVHGARGGSRRPSSAGSFSGEHGDGQSRGELLGRMFGPRIVAAFGELKAIFDPADRMNPGKVVAPARPDEHLRLGACTGRPPEPRDLRFGYPARRRLVHPGGQAAASAWGGVAGTTGRRQVMCPSYQVTGRRSTPRGAGPGCCSRCSTGTGTSRSGRAGAPTEVKGALDLLPGLQGLQDRLPGRRGHGHVQGGVPVPPLRGPPVAAGPARTLALGWLPVIARLVGGGSGWARW